MILHRGLKTKFIKVKDSEENAVGSNRTEPTKYKRTNGRHLKRLSRRNSARVQRKERGKTGGGDDPDVRQVSARKEIH